MKNKLNRSKKTCRFNREANKYAHSMGSRRSVIQQVRDLKKQLKPRVIRRTGREKGEYERVAELHYGTLVSLKKSCNLLTSMHQMQEA